MCLPPCREPVIEHDPRAAERLPEGVPVPGPRVKTVVVPEQHESSILDCMAGYENIHAGRHHVFVMVFVARNRHPVFAARLWNLERRPEMMPNCWSTSRPPWHQSRPGVRSGRDIARPAAAGTRR